MMNLKPSFPFLFFDPRFLIYYGIYLFKILHVHNIHLEGTVSQIFYLWLSFDFRLKNGKI